MGEERLDLGSNGMTQSNKKNITSNENKESLGPNPEIQLHQYLNKTLEKISK